MTQTFRNSALFFLALIAAIGIAAALSLSAQQPPPLPPGYVIPGPVTARGLAPRMHGEQLPTTGSRTFEVMFGPGDEIMSGLTEFAEKNHITSGYISGIGGLATATLGWGDPQKGGVKTIPVNKSASLHRSSAIFRCKRARSTYTRTPSSAFRTAARRAATSSMRTRTPSSKSTS